MRNSFKYKILLVYWQLFSKTKYRIAMQFKRFFKNLDKETKDSIVKAVLK